MITLPQVDTDSEDESEDFNDPSRRVSSGIICSLEIPEYKPRDPATRRPPRCAVSSLILAFYNGTAPDLHHRTLDEILASDAEGLSRHWQSLFPVPEETSWVPFYPTVNKEVRDAFHGSETLRGRLNDAFLKALWYFGFKIIRESDQIDKIVLDPALDSHRNFWDVLKTYNHNRIGAIIRSLRILGLERQAVDFYHALEVNSTKVSSSALGILKDCTFCELTFPPEFYEKEEDRRKRDPPRPRFWEM